MNITDGEDIQKAIQNIAGVQISHLIPERESGKYPKNKFAIDVLELHHRLLNLLLHLLLDISNKAPHEPSQAKLKFGSARLSFLNRAEPS